MGQKAQFDLAVVRIHKNVPGSGHKHLTDFAPSSLRTGMFWRFGSVEERRPVAVTVI